MRDDLHRSGRSWQISFDFPAELQFAAYVAREAGFAPAGENEEREVWRQWRVWWERWAARRAESEETAGLLVNRWLAAGFQPPDFAKLHETPLLQQLFREQWPQFREGWAVPEGMKMQMAADLQHQLQRVRMDRPVREQARAAGLQRVTPFTLVVDFVLWPDDLVYEGPAGYLLLGAGYLDERMAGSLAALVGAAVERLLEQAAV
ncbi:MAG: hypothetical protein RRC07_14015 [Anaerolineae bacterium]|nr:hypothetical protein [Anaerolineae bacterium]